MVEIPDPDKVLPRLREIGRGRAKEVLRSAFRGEAHPDPKMAALVVAWVRLIRQSFWVWRLSTLKTAMTVALAIGLPILLWVSGDPGSATSVALTAGGFVVFWLTVSLIFSRRYARAEKANLKLLQQSREQPNDMS